MKKCIRIGSISLTLICGVILAANVAQAGSGSPSRPISGEAPYGLSLHGEAKGTKLSGNIVVAFEDLRCENPGSAYCYQNGPDLAIASATLQLKKSGGNFDAKGSFVKVKLLNAPLGEVYFDDPFEVQAAAITAFTCDILQEFFDVADGECGSSGLEVVLKDLGEFYATEPDSLGNFTVMAELVLAVNDEDI